MPSVLLLSACLSPTAPPPAARSVLDEGWIARVVATPASFTAAIEGDREGWIALHRNDWPTAAAASGPAHTRAAAELARMHAVLADIAAFGWIALGTRWEASGGPPTGSLLPALVWAAAEDAGDKATADRWAGRARSVIPKRAAGGKVLAADIDDSLSERARLHLALRAGAQAPGPLSAEAGATPILAEQAGERELWDPWVHPSLAQAWGLIASRPDDAAGPGPEGPPPLFSDQLGLVGVPVDETLSALSLAIPAGVDDAEACRELVRGLDTRLDGWASQLGTSASADGKALLHDLQLVPATRARALVSLAIDALDSERPHCALAYAEMARDHAAGRAVTPINSPTLYAVLASASLRTGHTREALDALEVLAPLYPEVHGLDETLGDLAVLEGIHRAGDSREH